MKKINPQVVNEVVSACEAALMRHGFDRPRKGTVLFPISDDFLGWAGLNVGQHEHHVRINPFVGIHCCSLMKLVAELSGEKYQRGRYATFAVHMGNICPNVEVFEFSDEGQITFQAERLALTYERFGTPYMAAYASYEALLPVLKERIPMFGGYPQRYAATLYLLGRHEEARQFVIERVEAYAGEDSLIRDSFNKFATCFLRLTAH